MTVPRPASELLFPVDAVEAAAPLSSLLVPAAARSLNSFAMALPSTSSPASTPLCLTKLAGSSVLLSRLSLFLDVDTDVEAYDARLGGGAMEPSGAAEA
jgi:hypothetical protein